MKLRCLSQLLSRRIPHSTVAPLRFDLTASPSLPPHKATTTSSHKMPLQFSANLNFLFIKENANVLERYRLARRAGFRAVENTFPLDVSVADAVAVQREIGLEVVLLNICVGRLCAPTLMFILYYSIRRVIMHNIEHYCLCCQREPVILVVLPSQAWKSNLGKCCTAP